MSEKTEDDCFGTYEEGHEECLQCDYKNECDQLTPGYASNWWYLLPIFLGLIGGIIASIIVVSKHKRNKKSVPMLLIVGTFFSLIWISGSL